MNPPAPQVSVIMPVFNSAGYLEQAIRSVLSQTLVDFELLLIDDGSTDASPHIIAGLRDPRLVKLTNPRNLGLPASLNRALGVARAPLIARNDADDVSAPQRLQRQVDYLQAHPGAGLVGSAVQVIDEHGKPGRVARFPSSDAVLKWRLLFSNPFAHSAVMFRSGLARDLGGYREVVGEDHDLWLRMSRHTTLHNLPERLVSLRRYPGTLTATRLQSGRSAGAAASLEFARGLLDISIQPETMQTLWGLPASVPAPVQSAADLVAVLLEQPLFSRCSPAERRAILQDAARRLLRLQTQRRLPAGLRLQLLSKALALDPLLLPRVAANRVFMALRRPLYG